MNASSGSPLPTAFGSSTRPRSTAPRRNFKKWFEQDPKVRKQIVLVTKDMPRHPRDTATHGRRAAGGSGDRLHRPLLHPRPGRSADRRRIDQHGHQPGVQGDGRRDPQVGQGQVHRLLDPQQGSRPDHRGGGQGGLYRRDHAPVPPVARQGLSAQQGARRLLEEARSA